MVTSSSAIIYWLPLKCRINSRSRWNPKSSDPDFYLPFDDDALVEIRSLSLLLWLSLNLSSAKKETKSTRRKVEERMGCLDCHLFGQSTRQTLTTTTTTAAAFSWPTVDDSYGNSDGKFSRLNEEEEDVCIVGIHLTRCCCCVQSSCRQTIAVSHSSRQMFSWFKEKLFLIS